MSEHNLLNYNLFKTNDNNISYNFNFPISQPLADQRRVNTTNNRNYHHTAYDPTFINDPTPFYLPPITTTNHVTFTISQPQQKEQLVMDNSVSQSAIIIKEKAFTTHTNNDHHNKKTSSDDQTPTHIVSPEAIREALKEEKEEELGHSQSRPFSQYSSFHALKQRRFSTDHSPPSVSIPFSPPPSIKLKDDDDDDEEEEDDFEEPESPFPTSNDKTRYHHDTNTVKNHQQEKLKRPPNAYLLFNRDMRRKLLKQSPKMTVAEISKEVGDWWKALPDDKREYYVKEASILKEEHLKKYPDFIYTRRSKAELAEAKKSSKLGRKAKSETITLTNSDNDEEEDVVNMYNNNKSLDLLVNDNPKKRSRKSSAAGGQRDPRGRKKKRHKHPFAPKHPMSAYLYYLASVYPQVSLNFPGSTVGPISKSISRTWHAMTPEERLPWKQKAESDKARYAREMQEYMAKNNEEQLLQQQQQQQQQLQQHNEQLQLQQQQQQQQLRQQQQQQYLFDPNNNNQFHQLLSSDEEVTSLKNFEGDDEDDEEVDVHTIAAVVQMVNNNNGGNKSLIL